MRVLYVTVTVMLLLTGCAGLTPPLSEIDNQAAWKRRLAKLSTIGRWELVGRMSLRNDEDAYQASLNWSRNRDRHQIDLTGPFGRGYIRLRQDRTGAVMRDSDKRIYRAPNAQVLLRQTTGWDMPLQGMAFWVLGMPMPGHARELRLDRQGRLQTLNQQGWEIRFIEYRAYGGIELPRKIYLSRSQGRKRAGTDGHRVLEVRLVINRWRLHYSKQTAPTTH